MPRKSKVIGLLHCGAPAPGMNRAAQVVVEEAHRAGYSVVGLDGGFQALANGDLAPRTLSPEDVKGWAQMGGSLLATSRFNPANVSGSAARIADQLFGKGGQALGLSGLIVQGGDNTLSACSQVSRESPKGSMITLIPSTVDNDLPLPVGDQTLGHASFVERTAKKVTTLGLDARSCGRWYIAVTQGRHTGHVAASAAIAGSADLAFIPELWKRKVTMDQLVVIILASILKRFVAGQRAGVVVVPASIFNVVEGDEKLQGLRVDNFGQRLFREVYVANRLARKLMKLCLAWGVEGLEIEGEGLSGFSERSAPPRNEDDTLATTLAMQAIGHLSQSNKSALISKGSALPFSQVVDRETGWAKSRPYDLLGKTWGDFWSHTGPFDQRALQDDALLQAMVEAARNINKSDLKDQIAASLAFVEI